MNNEIWKPIPGSKGYEASSQGRIRNRHGRILKDAAHRCGYRLIGIRAEDSTRWQDTVHAFVALAFHGPRPDGMEVAHGDHDKTNNVPSNLRYATRKENMNDGHPRTGDRWLPWGTVEVGEIFDSGTNASNSRRRAEREGRRLNRAFEVEHTGPNTSRVTRRPMLGAMTCQATAHVGGPQA